MPIINSYKWILIFWCRRSRPCQPHNICTTPWTACGTPHAGPTRLSKICPDTFSVLSSITLAIYVRLFLCMWSDFAFLLGPPRSKLPTLHSRATPSLLTGLMVCPSSATQTPGLRPAGENPAFCWLRLLWPRDRWRTRFHLSAKEWHHPSIWLSWDPCCRAAHGSLLRPSWPWTWPVASRPPPAVCFPPHARLSCEPCISSDRGCGFALHPLHQPPCLLQTCKLRWVSHDCRRLLVRRFQLRARPPQLQDAPACFVLWTLIPFPRWHRLRRLHHWVRIPTRLRTHHPPPTTPHPCRLPRQQRGWRDLVVSGTVSLGVPCLRSCSIPMPVSSSSYSWRYPACFLLLVSRAFAMAALCRAASLVLFDVSTSRLFAASLCLSTHRSDRRCLQPFPQLLQRPRAHNSAESSSPQHMQRREPSVQGTCWGLRCNVLPFSAFIILSSAATLTESWTYSLWLASCSAIGPWWIAFVHQSTSLSMARWCRPWRLLPQQLILVGTICSAPATWEHDVGLRCFWSLWVLHGLFVHSNPLRFDHHVLMIFLCTWRIHLRPIHLHKVAASLIRSGWLLWSLCKASLWSFLSPIFWWHYRWFLHNEDHRPE